MSILKKFGNAILTFTERTSLDRLRPDMRSIDRNDPAYELNRNVPAGLDITYIARNVVAMGFPSATSTRIRSSMDASTVAQFLRDRHHEHFMIWNLAEESYDYGLFQNQVIEYTFRGHPAPPLGLLFKLVTSMENWLSADEKNVVVVHCMTGKGRTAVTIAALLLWLQRFANPQKSLSYVCEHRGSSRLQLTNPSQRRYMDYFGYMYDGVRPRAATMVLRRVIMHGVPRFDVLPSTDELVQDTESERNTVQLGCRPVLQMFRNGKLLFSSTWRTQTDHEAKIDTIEDTTPQWYAERDGSIRFAVDIPLRGDVLIRCRHVTAQNKRASMFRAAVHVGYVNGQLLRLSKQELDLACRDERFPDDFFIEFVFEPVIVMHSKKEESKSESTPTNQSSAVGNEFGPLCIQGDDSGPYDAMVEADSGFWDEVARKKAKRGETTLLRYFDSDTNTPQRQSAFTRKSLKHSLDIPSDGGASGNIHKTFDIGEDSEEETTDTKHTKTRQAGTSQAETRHTKTSQAETRHTKTSQAETRQVETGQPVTDQTTTSEGESIRNEDSNRATSSSNDNHTAHSSAATDVDESQPSEENVENSNELNEKEFEELIGEFEDLDAIEQDQNDNQAMDETIIENSDINPGSMQSPPTSSDASTATHTNTTKISHTKHSDEIENEESDDEIADMEEYLRGLEKEGL